MEDRKMAREENQVIICEWREEKKGKTGGEHRQKTNKDVHEGDGHSVQIYSIQCISLKMTF